MSPRFVRSSLTWLAYLMLAFYGYFLNIFGPITPFLMDEFKLSYTASSLHFSAFAAGILLVGLGGSAVIQRLGRWRALWLGAAGISLGALLLVLAPSPVLTIGAAFLMGLVGSLILAIIPAALSDLHGELRPVAISEANVIASAIATAAPLIVGWASALPGGWRLALGVSALAPLLMRLAFGKASLANENTVDSGDVSHRPNPPKIIISTPGLPGQGLPRQYWRYWLALFLSVSVEFCMIFWSAAYLEKELGMPQVSAAQAVSLFLGAMIAGRLVVSRLAQHVRPRSLVNASLLVAAAGFLLFWRGGSLPLAMSGLFLTGLGVAGLYPLILSLAIGTAGERAVLASARATLASGSAILLLPLVLGRLADAFGLHLAYSLLLLLLAGVLALSQGERRAATQRRGVHRV